MNDATPRFRLTMPTRMVLDVLMNADPGDPPWGYWICETANLGSGTVYPILERLEEARWIEGRWETGTPPDRPRRRFYTLTSTGRQEYAAALTRRATRRWPALQPRPHGTQGSTA